MSGPAAVRAVTFDLGNTLVDGGDYAEVRERRFRHIADVLLEHGSKRDRDEIVAAWEAAEALAREAFEREQRQLDVAGSTGTLLQSLGVDLDHVARDALAEALQDLLPEGFFRPAEGIHALLAALRERGIPLGIVSNLGWTPGRIIRRHLEPLHLLEFFEPAAIAWSDEIGVLKPHPAIFEHALRGLGVAPEDTVHVGDLKLTDVAGARALGVTTVRYRGVYDDPTDAPDADVVVSHHDELLEAVGV